MIEKPTIAEIEALGNPVGALLSLHLAYPNSSVGEIVGTPEFAALTEQEAMAFLIAASMQVAIGNGVFDSFSLAVTAADLLAFAGFRR